MSNELTKFTLRKYKKLLQLIKRLPLKESEDALKQLRAEVRRNSSVSESESVVLREKMEEHIRYLKMITPKHPGDSGNLEEISHYVVRDGKVVEGTAVRESRVADGTISMSEARSIHQKLLKRQHFGRQAPKYDPRMF